MWIALRKALIVLTSLAFLIGIGAQVMPSAVMGESCAMMTMQGNPGHAPMKQELCKRAPSGCICSPALPAPSTPLASPFAWGRLSYWPPLAPASAGLSIEPNLHPPTAA